MVGLADLGLAVLAAASRPFGRRVPAARPRRILLLRLERIGDLLMAAPAIAAVRALAPGARLDLVVGSWNEPIAQMLGQVDRIQTLDARWLSRGASAPGFAALLRRARRWRDERYDLAINFEGDIRSHLLMACSGAPRRIGFDMAGGGPLLTDRVPYDPSRHVADNLLRLVDQALAASAATEPPLPDAAGVRQVLSGTVGARRAAPVRNQRLEVPAAARAGAAALLAEHGADARDAGDRRRPLIGVHVSAGRPVKQWDPVRFGELAARLAARHDARVVFTGSDDDRALVDLAVAHVPDGAAVIQLCGRADLVMLAALLERFSVFVTCDSGPMHLAAAIGTPLVAIFGPSDSRRWGPISGNARVVQSDVDCRPCNRIRRPPARCAGRTPDCLAAISVDQVLEAVEQVLAAGSVERRGRDDVTVETGDAGR
jgi:lipopolysaccharide heptosyltransferase II